MNYNELLTEEEIKELELLDEDLDTLIEIKKEKMDDIKKVEREITDKELRILELRRVDQISTTWDSLSNSLYEMRRIAREVENVILDRNYLTDMSCMIKLKENIQHETDRIVKDMDELINNEEFVTIPGRKNKCT